MKLNIVPARVGIQWAFCGVRTFFKQPLAFTGLFFMFMAGLSLLAQIPYAGDLLAMTLAPAAFVGLMNATNLVEQGRFPMPDTLLVALRQGPGRTRAILTLGVLLALGMALADGILMWIDGGYMAQLQAAITAQGNIPSDALKDPRLVRFLLAAILLHLPFSLLFWHAPALVHWNAVAPVKSLFFSSLAVLKNARAFALYALSWLLIYLVANWALFALAMLFGSADIAKFGLLPMLLLIWAMFCISAWFTYRDCFAQPAGNAEPPA
ncbi:MAG: hypothetical protein LBP52_08695 [Burkholderiaceae bacterium]|jgi:hypothetical protein|nr:hypothetical protein [Burkholderiaceae bacterium]